MALCDFVISQDIIGYDCDNPPVKGAESTGILINRSDINYSTASVDIENWHVVLGNEYSFKCDKQPYKIKQAGKQPFQGTQQELVEGTYQNTITNTLQFVVLKQDEDVAEQLFALMNGEFVAVLANKNGTYQVYGFECGLHCTGAVRELYNDDTLSGWLITFTEEGATRGNLFCDRTDWGELIAGSAGICDD